MELILRWRKRDNSRVNPLLVLDPWYPCYPWSSSFLCRGFGCGFAELRSSVVELNISGLDAVDFAAGDVSGSVLHFLRFALAKK